VTQLLPQAAEQEGGYRLFRNPHVSPLAAGKSAWEACAKRVRHFPRILVPVDQTSLSIEDGTRDKGLGPIGNGKARKGRGYNVMSGLGLSPEGVGYGLLGQAYWTRKEEKAALPGYARSLLQKETHYWLKVMGRARAVLKQHAPDTRPTFLVDAAGDFHEMLEYVVEEDVDAIIRAAQDRRVLSPEDGLLWDVVSRQPVLQRRSVYLAREHARPARWAHLEVRACTVQVRLKPRGKKQTRLVTLGAVHVKEVSRVPPGQERVQWLLLTTLPVDTPEAAGAVVEEYCLRWRCEDFHRAWKEGACHVEDTQLRKGRRILLLALILASVAARAEALKTRSREEPDVPATEMYALSELQAALLLSHADDSSEEAASSLTLLEATLLIGQLGGWAGKYSGTPPGTQVLMRGLAKVETAATALVEYKRTHPP
jgi:hypothetical protein